MTMIYNGPVVYKRNQGIFEIVVVSYDNRYHVVLSKNWERYEWGDWSKKYKGSDIIKEVICLTEGSGIFFADLIFDCILGTISGAYA